MGVQPTSWGSGQRRLVWQIPSPPSACTQRNLSMLCLPIATDWCAGVASAAAALPQGVALKQWQAPLLASHADNFLGQ